MKNVRFVGLDVRKESIAIAVADRDGSAPEDVATIPNDTTTMVRRLKKLGHGGKVKCCHEAGPTEFVLQRALHAAGIECAVVAPLLVPRTAGNRVNVHDSVAPRPGNERGAIGAVGTRCSVRDGRHEFAARRRTAAIIDAKGVRRLWVRWTTNSPFVGECAKHL